MLAACSTDTTENVASTLPYDVLYVSVGDEDESRIQLDGNSRIVWNEGDKVSVFNKTSGNECWQFDGKTGDRSGTLSKVSGDAGLISTDKVIALYPYDQKCVVSGNMISTTIPATQNYRADSFGDGGSIMVAVSDDDNLFFDSVLGWIKLSLTDDLERKVQSIVLNGNNGEKLAGSIIIDASTQKVYMEGSNISSITLDCGEGVQLSKTAPAYFYIALAPQAFAKGVTVDVKTTDGKLLKKYYEQSFSVTRNRIYTIKAGNLQSANNTIFYTTDDGKPVIMGKTEGFGANFISNTYANGQGIIRFDRNIASIPGAAFGHCETLTSITIPDSVTSIGGGAFANCSSLTSVTIPDSVTSIRDSAFYGCSSLTSITISDSVIAIGYKAFHDCIKLTSIYITDIAKWCQIKFTDYDSNPLYYAHNLYINGELVENLTIPDGVTEIGSLAFSVCSRLKSVTIPNSVTSISNSAFNFCSSLTSFTIPDSVTSIGDYAFYGCSSLTSIYCKPTTPPILGSNAFSSISPTAKIYVPMASVDAYNRSNWGYYYKSNIVGYDF